MDTHTHTHRSDRVTEEFYNQVRGHVMARGAFPSGSFLKLHFDLMARATPSEV